MKQQLLTIATIACISLAIIPTAMAKNSQHVGPMHAFSLLALSEQQKQEIRDIYTTNRENNSVFAGEKKAVKQQMNSLMNMPTWDEAAARSIITSQIEQGKSIALNHAKARHSAYNVLDDAQKASLSALNSDSTNESIQRKSKNKRLKNRNNGAQRLSKALVLSDEQVAQISAIDKDTAAQMQTLKESSNEQRTQMRAIIHANSFNDEAWLALHEKSLNNTLNYKLIKAKAKYDKRAILNDAQKSIRVNIMHKMKGKRSKARHIS